jgi:hypothetical protein
MLGIFTALRYSSLGLTLSHYDARGHLVVARRIFDSITPGWQQIGAVWLPLPHLLNALPVQIDTFYRTGASAVAVSVASYAIATGAIAWIIAALTESWLAAVAGALVFALNPNVLYLQSTPMTEPLLAALTVASIALLIAYCEQVVAPKDPPLGTNAPDVGANLSGLQNGAELRVGSRTTVQTRRSVESLNPTTTTTSSPSATLVGWTLILACMTRYEAWPVTIAGLVAAAWAVWRGGVLWSAALRAVGRVAIYPIAAIVGFSVFSRIVVGAWFANGFFVPENPAQGHPVDSIRLIVWGVNELSGRWLVGAALLGGAILVAYVLFARNRALSVLPLALLGMAAVPWSAFIDGHPYRIRYMVPLIAVQALFAGVAAGSWQRARVALTGVLLLITVLELRPFDLSAPMVAEAQWDRPNFAPRDAVARCLRDGYRGDSIMASMGSLGHYMQDLAKAGFSIRDFLHEGNGDIWLNALYTPRPYAGWILIEEKAEGGDMLAAIARERPEFLTGYSRVCEGAGLALYRRGN